MIGLAVTDLLPNLRDFILLEQVHIFPQSISNIIVSAEGRGPLQAWTAPDTDTWVSAVS